MTSRHAIIQLLIIEDKNMADIYDIVFIQADRPLGNRSYAYLYDKDVILVHQFFVGVCIGYIPLITISNVCIFWGIVLYPGFYTNNNIHLLSLAVADFFEGAFSLPMYVLSYMPSTRNIIFANKYACLAWFSSTVLGAGCSLMSLCCIALDRYIAVMWPLQYRTMITVERTSAAMLILWTTMIILAVLPSMGWNNYDASIQNLNHRCDFYTTLPPFYVRAFLIGPSVTMIFVSTVLYLQIIFIVRKQAAVAVPRKMSVSMKSDTIQSTKANMKLTSILMFLFIIMWLPYLMIAPFKYYNYASDKVVEIFKCFALLLTFGNSFFNALIYAALRQEYTSVYKLMVRTLPWHWRVALHELHRRKRGSVYFSKQSDYSSQERKSIMDRSVGRPSTNVDADKVFWTFLQQEVKKQEEKQQEEKRQEVKQATKKVEDDDPSRNQHTGSSEKSTGTDKSGTATAKSKSFTTSSFIKISRSLTPNLLHSIGMSSHSLFVRFTPVKNSMSETDV